MIKPSYFGIVKEVTILGIQFFKQSTELSQERIQFTVVITTSMTCSSFNFLVQNNSWWIMQWMDLSSASLQDILTLDLSFATSPVLPQTIAGAPSVVTLTHFDQSTLNFLRLFSTYKNKSLSDVWSVMCTMSKSSSVMSKFSSTPRINIINWLVLFAYVLSSTAIGNVTNDVFSQFVL